MPEISRPGFREFLPSANQALAELEEATGKPVQIVEDPQLNVLATIRRGGPAEATHVLRIKEGENQAADYLIVFECRMALRDGGGTRWVVQQHQPARDRLIHACEQLHRQLPPGKASQLGQLIYDALILQLRSMGPGMLVDRWIREHCPDLRAAQEQAIEAQITGNQVGLNPSTRSNVPAAAGDACLSMNAAYAVFGGDLLGKPYLAVPYLSQGFGEIARRLISLALAEEDTAKEGADRRIVDGWAQELGLGDWYEWCELPE